VSAPVLALRDLTVAVRNGPVLVDQVSLDVGAGEIVGLVGESGSGKSMTAYSVMGLFPSAAAYVAGGSVVLEGRALTGLSPRAWREVRGARIGMVFQDPTGFLDPLLPAGKQIAEALVAHGVRAGREARVQELLAQVELPAHVATRYPHELSGGQRQRVLIAAALALRPALLIADEPTTALDVTVQAGILALLRRLSRETGLAVLLITHDLGVVAETCARVYVMYGGQIVEQNAVRPLFAAPRHPYTQGLLASVLGPDARPETLFSVPGAVPSPRALPAGCRFHPRCPLCLPEPCTVDAPGLMARDTGGADRCWRADEAVARDAWALHADG
jgi:oligopeptide/dipeptide ABC transporter ATP-binding protein